MKTLPLKRFSIKLNVKHYLERLVRMRLERIHINKLDKNVLSNFLELKLILKSAKYKIDLFPF